MTISEKSEILGNYNCLTTKNLSKNEEKISNSHTVYPILTYYARMHVECRYLFKATQTQTDVTFVVLYM